jgi:hypothetical protein
MNRIEKDFILSIQSLILQNKPLEALELIKSLRILSDF